MLLKRTPPPARVVLIPENVRSFKVTSAVVAPFIVKSLPAPPSPVKVELASSPSIVKAKLLDVKYAPLVETVPMIISLSPSLLMSFIASPKLPRALASLVPSFRPAPVAET